MSNELGMAMQQAILALKARGCRIGASHVK